MVPEKNSLENNQGLIPFPRLRPIKSIPAIKYYIEKSTFISRTLMALACFEKQGLLGGNLSQRFEIQKH